MTRKRCFFFFKFLLFSFSKQFHPQTWNQKNEQSLTIEMKGISGYQLTIISESAVCKKFLGQIWSQRPVYRFLIVIHQNATLLFKCFCFCLYHRFERIFLSFLWFILMNAQMSTQLQKNSFKYMSCSHRIQQFPRSSLCWQAPGCIQNYSFKSVRLYLLELFRDQILKGHFSSTKGYATWLCRHHPP